MESGLRLGFYAAVQLSDPTELAAFQKWLADTNCYVFTINGFPYGKFHGTRVKEQVYLPDWTSTERVAYTNLLFDLIAELSPIETGGSISTVPGSFKEFIHSPSQVDTMRDNVTRCAEHIAKLREKNWQRPPSRHGTRAALLV